MYYVPVERLDSIEEKRFVNEIIYSKITTHHKRLIECFSVGTDITICASCFQTEKCIEMTEIQS